MFISFQSSSNGKGWEHLNEKITLKLQYCKKVILSCEQSKEKYEN